MLAGQIIPDFDKVRYALFNEDFHSTYACGVVSLRVSILCPLCSHVVDVSGNVFADVTLYNRWLENGLLCFLEYYNVRVLVPLKQVSDVLIAVTSSILLL